MYHLVSMIHCSFVLTKLCILWPKISVIHVSCACECRVTCIVFSEAELRVFQCDCECDCESLARWKRPRMGLGTGDPRAGLAKRAAELGATYVHAVELVTEVGGAIILS